MKNRYMFMIIKTVLNQVYGDLSIYYGRKKQKLFFPYLLVKT